MSIRLFALMVGLGCGAGGTIMPPDEIPDRDLDVVDGGGDAAAAGRDGAAERGGTDDATARDAVRPDGAPLVGLQCDAARFCDDFESYTAGVKPAGGWTVNGAVVVDVTKAFSGSKAIVIRGPASSETTGVISRGRGILPFDSNTIYGRMMVWLTAAPPGGVHWDSIWATGRIPDTTVRAQYRYGGARERIIAVYDTSARPNPDCNRSSQTKFPVQRWACLQWQFDGSPDGLGGTRNEARLWVDGKPLNDATVVRTGNGCVSAPRTTEWKAPIFDTFQVGWLNYQVSSVPIEMWIDDVAFDEKPVSCP